MSCDARMRHRRSLLISAGLFASSLLACDLAAGGTPHSNAPITFSLKAPCAKAVTLRGQWANKDVAMERGGGGTWSVSLDSVPAGIWEYSFVVDGLNVLDPRNSTIKPQHEPQKSVLHIPSTPPAPWDWQDIPHGAVHTHDYQSKALGRQRELLVYTPPGYEADRAMRFPLLVLQHGSGDNQRTWVEHGKAHWILDSLIAGGKAKPMIVLMIDGHPYGTAPQASKDRRVTALDAFRNELFDDAIPFVEKNYRLAEGRENRALVGLSMGGRQSLTIGLNSLDRFAWVGSFSGAADLDALKPAIDSAKETNERLELLWIACGREDFLLDQNKAIVAALAKNGIHHEWRLTDGGHAWPVWRGYLADFAPLLFRK
jgi:enterochelin esterase-like enzyme